MSAATESIAMGAAMGALVELGKRGRDATATAAAGAAASSNKRKILAATTPPLNRHAAFPDAFCVAVIQAMRAETSFAITAAALLAMDGATGAVIFSGTWKLFQSQFPAEAANTWKCTSRKAGERVKEYEGTVGYFFVDKSSTTSRLSIVRRAITGVARECGYGCFSAEHEYLKLVLGESSTGDNGKRQPAVNLAKPVPAFENAPLFAQDLGRPTWTPIRNKDILADAHAIAMHIRNTLFVEK